MSIPRSRKSRRTLRARCRSFHRRALRAGTRTSNRSDVAQCTAYATAAWPLAARAAADEAAHHRIPGLKHAFFSNQTDRRHMPGLRELGWIEGCTVAIEYRWAEGQYNRLPALAAELIPIKSS